MPEQSELLILTSEIVVSHVANNVVSTDALPALIQSVYGVLARLGKPIDEPAEVPVPAVSIRSSIKPGYIVCLEDGKKLTMLKRYLMTHYSMTPEQYRSKWKLPADYPMVAPDYAERRRTLAKAIGLGHRAAPEVLEPTSRVRKAKAVTASTE